MRSRSMSVRTFLAASALGILAATLSAGATAWKIDRDVQQADRDRQFSQAAAFVSHDTTRATDAAWIQRFARQLAVLRTDAELSLDEPGQGTRLLYASPDLLVAGEPAPTLSRQQERAVAPAAPEQTTSPRATYAFSVHSAPPGTRLTLSLWGPALDGTRSLLAAVAAALAALLMALALAALAATRWIVRPLRRLSAAVDAVAGGEFVAAGAPSRLSEIGNISAAISGMGEALRATADKDARADAQRRFMVGAAAHDLRTPLFALRGYLEAIASGIGPADRHLERARAKAAQLDRLVATLFAHARTELGEPARLETADLLEAVRDAAGGFELQAAERRIRLRITGDTVLAAIDRDRFERVLANVLENALRHATAGSAVDIAVERGVALGRPAAYVRVSDDGPGIPDDLLPRIFEPMVRGEHAEPRGGGLGLAIAARLVESQHGAITAANRRGAGACFTIRLPLAEEIASSAA